MKSLITAAAAAAIVTASGFVAQAQTPGLDMQTRGSVSGSPGASGYAPGRLMQENGSVRGTTGASGYASGHTTRGVGVRSNAEMRGGRGGMKAGVRAGGRVK